MILIILFVILLIAFVLIARKRKRLKLDCVTMINGAIGSGKTSTATYLALKHYKKAIFKWKFRKAILHKNEEKPLLYANFPLFGVDYVPLTMDLILRNKIRFAYKSVMLIDEASLIADSMDYKDKLTNDKLSFFLLAFRHETRGGKAFICTQSKNDLHFSFDRKTSQSLYLTKSLNLWLFRVVWCRELLLIDSKVENNIENDFKEDSCNYWFIVPCSVFKHYNHTYLSYLSDNWQVAENVVNNGKKPKCKAFEIITLHTTNEEINKNNEVFK